MRKFMAFAFIVVICVLIIIELYMRFFGNYCEPWFDKKEKIVKRKPNTEGVYKTEYTSTGYFRVNNEGWNSQRDYERKTEKGERNTVGRSQDNKKLRIAIVGHSNIEGLRVPVDKTLSKILEDDLNQKAIPVEVYPFGFGGMHLAQAMHVSRYVINQFDPDMLIIGTMLDDFWAHSTNKKSFLNLTIDDKGSIKEVLPHKYVYEEKSPFSFLYFLKFVYHLDKKTRMGEWMNFIFKNGIKHRCKNNDQEINTPSDRESAYRYIIHEFNKIAKKDNDAEISLYFVQFPHVIPSYNYDYEEHQTLANQKGNLLEKLIHENHFQVIELEKAFIDDYKINGKKFDFEHD